VWTHGSMQSKGSNRMQQHEVIPLFNPEGAGAKAAAELDTTRLQEAVGVPLATAADSSQRIISSLSDEEVVSFVQSLR